MSAEQADAPAAPWSIAIWLPLAVFGVGLLALRLSRSRLDQPYIRIADLALPLWLIVFGLVVFLRPPPRDLWSPRTVQYAGLALAGIGAICALLPIFSA